MPAKPTTTRTDTDCCANSQPPHSRDSESLFHYAAPVPTTKPTILIADDQADVLQALHLLFKGEGYQVESVKSPAKVLETLRAREFELLLMDLNYARDTTSGK